MMEAVLKGLALGFVLALSVGPIIFTIIKQSLNNGHKGGFSFVVGVWVSDILLVVLSNTLTELVAQLLEEAQLAQGDGVAEVDIGCGRVDAVLDAQRLARLDAAL